MGMDYTSIEKWDDTFNGGAIYSLVDQNGKRYIGQSRHLQNRLHMHRKYLNTIIRTKGEEWTPENEKMRNAVLNGVRFKVEILKKFEWQEVTYSNLRYWEEYYLKKFGGLESTYNFTYTTYYDFNNPVPTKVLVKPY